MSDEAMHDEVLPVLEDATPAVVDPAEDAPDLSGTNGATVLAGGQAVGHGDEVLHWTRTLIAVSVILVVAIGIAVAAAMSRKKAPRRQGRPVPTGVRVATAKVRDVHPEVVGLGRARPSRKVVISAQVGGLAETVHPLIEDGAFIEGGVVAVQIDQADHRAEEQRQRAQVDVAKADQRRLQAQVAHVTSRVEVTREQLGVELDNLTRAEELLRKGVGTDRELESARLAALRSKNSLLTLESSKDLLGPQIDAARARVSEAQARHALALLKLQRTTVRTPFPGLVANVRVEEHQLVSPGSPLFELWQIEQVDVPVVLSLREGMLMAGDLGVRAKGTSDEAHRVEVEHEADGQISRWDGVLLRFEPVDGDTQTVKAVVRVENPPDLTPLLPEVFCKVRMESEVSQRGLTIPVGALQEQGQVYVVRKGHLAIVTPKFGRRLGAWIIVESGLAAGDQVIVSPLDKVIEGTELKILEVAEVIRIITSAIKSPVFANLLMLLLIAAGLRSLMILRREMFPEFAFDIVAVTAIYPGATPSEIERSVTIKIEEAVRGLGGVHKVESTASEGRTTVRIEVDSEVADPRDVLVDVRNEISRITTFPEDVEDPEVELTLNRREVMILALVAAEADSLHEESLTNMARDLEEELLLLPEVSEVTVAGLRPREIEVAVREGDLQARGLRFADITRAIRQASLDLPIGKMRSGDEEQILRVQSQRQVGRELLDVPIVSRPDGTRVLLADVANVTDGFDEDRVEVRIDGKPAVLLTVGKTSDEDTLKVAAAVKTWLESKQGALPPTVTLSAWRDGSIAVTDRLSLLTVNGLQGLFLVFLVLIVFLGLRLSFWVALGLPVAFLTAMILLEGFGASLNMISSFGLIMVLGILVDDSIVVAENIARHMRDGGHTVASAIAGLKEVAWPVTASVTTTAIAFLPLFYIGGVMGKFIRIMPVAVVACLIASLVECLLILPAHLAHGGPPPQRETGLKRLRRRIDAWTERFIEHRYGPTIDWALNNRYTVLALATGAMIVILGFVASGRPGFVFFPRLDSQFIEANIVMPQGTPIERTQAVIDRIYAATQTMKTDYPNASDGKPLIRRVLTRVGEGGSQKASVRVELARSNLRDIKGITITKQWKELTGDFPEARSVSMAGTRHRPGGKPIEIRIMAPNQEQSAELAVALRTALATYPGVFNVQDNLEPGKRELRFDLKPSADVLGIGMAGMARQLYAGFSGEEVYKIQRGRDEVEVRVRYEADLRRSPEQLTDMRLRTERGLLPLGWAANLERGRSLSRIERRDGRRVVTLTGDVDDAVTNARNVNTSLKEKVLPDLQQRYPDTLFVFGGQQEEETTTLTGLLLGFVLACLGIYGILALLFNSYIQPVIVMMVIPLGFAGAILGHMVLGYPIMIFSVFGMVGLTGIVVNDALVLIDFVNRKRRAGVPAWESASVAGRVRFRAVFLTTVTTVVGLLPIMLETSLQAQFVIPMALSISSGVAAATFLTLYVVPCAYLVVDDVRGLFFSPASPSAQPALTEAS